MKQKISFILHRPETSFDNLQTNTPPPHTRVNPLFRDLDSPTLRKRSGIGKTQEELDKLVGDVLRDRKISNRRGSNVSITTL